MESEIKNLNRRQFLAALGTTATAAALCSHGSAAKAAARSGRPNFVFIRIPGLCENSQKGC